nr:hypothetical protein [Tanacetum cinerariifolium]
SNSQQDLKDKGVIDSGCSRHMTRNKSYLIDYEEIDAGFVAFGGNSKGGKITGKDFKLTDESHVLLKVSRKDNMYSVDLKNVVPQRDLTCLFTKAISNESTLWHMILGHVNIKTINKLVKGNLVRGLPSKLFEINQTYVACQKGKQHIASCNTKIVSLISQPLQMLHMDLFVPTFVSATFVKSLMKKMYCLVVTNDFSRSSWVFFLATKDETTEILKTFIIGIENLIDLKVKVIRCDNGTEFKNRVMNQFCEMKGRKPVLSFMRPFGCPVTILNTIDHLGNQSNGSVGKARVETVPDNDYILLPLWTQDPPLSSSLKDSPGAGYKQSGEEEKKDTEDPENEDSEAPITEEPRVNQEKDSVNSTNRVNAVSLTINAANNEVNAFGRKSSIELPYDLNMPDVEDISIFEDSNEDVFGAETDLNNMESTFQVNLVPTIRIHKDHPLEQVIRDLQSAPQTRR